jgi:predicted membrane channel-forming protein YqfA (hemolysin III family)
MEEQNIRGSHNRRELTADGLVHAVGVTLGVAGAIAIMVVAAHRLNPRQIVPIFIYAAGLVAMLGCSAAYNANRTIGGPPLNWVAVIIRLFGGPSKSSARSNSRAARPPERSG